MEIIAEINRIRTLISRWVVEIEAYNAESLYDINKVSENIALHLLNLIFNLKLEDLNKINKNFPAVDLGDYENGIAYQVTSRIDKAKITHSIDTFDKHNLKKSFPNGIRFLVLKFKLDPMKPGDPGEKAPGFIAACHNGVRADTPKRMKTDTNELAQHIGPPRRGVLTCDDLIRGIEAVYFSDPERYREIKQLLERQLGDEKKGALYLPLLLLKGSRQYHRDLTGPTGRFKHLQIADLLLAGTRQSRQTKPGKGQAGHENADHHNRKWIPQPVSLEEAGEEAGKDRDDSVIHLLPRLWPKTHKHAVIVGEGGMGKTVSLVRLWETLLDQCSGGLKGPVPVFIPLHEYNNPRLSKGDFIAAMIAKHYLDDSVPTAEVRKLLQGWQTGNGGAVPAVVLLLDGFNEITVEKRDLLLELQDLLEHAHGVQIVVTSRFDMRFHQQWGDFNLLRLQKLEPHRVERYLAERGLDCPAPGRLMDLVANPMMLTLYAAACEVVKEHRDAVYCKFKEVVESPGELLWNFMEAQVAKLPERLQRDQEEMALYSFLLKFLLPALGYEMEKAGLFSFTAEQLNGHVDEYRARFGREDFFEAFPEFARYIRSLRLGVCADINDQIERREYLKDLLVEKLSLLVESEGVYGFLHQDFRDFFAAVHVLNEMVMGVKVTQVPGLLRQGVLSFFVRRFLGEIQGEHRARPYLVKERGWKLDENKDSLLNKVLDLCRGHFDGEMGFAVWNIVETWKEVRGELSGADLSELDLGKVGLNGVVCSRVYGDDYLAAGFNESLVHASNLFPQGHSNLVTSAVYSGDGKKILSTSTDKTIKEWNAATGECVRTLNEHSYSVNSAVYSGDGKKILSASTDKTIKEWNAATGECVRTLKGHTSIVNSAVYSGDGKKILSASWDNTIKEWDAATGECVKTLKGHSGSLCSAVYSGDGKKILSASFDHTIKEWDTATGGCIRTLKEHSGSVYSAVYSGDEKKILSASSDKTIKEWDVVTGECVRTLKGHSGIVFSAVYSGDGEKILSASSDHTVKEWDIATGECVRTLIGHSDYVRSAVYSGDGKKILSASSDHTIKEWDAATGECVRTLKGHSGNVSSAVYSSDGKKILSASSDHTIKE
jgi:WD40 repeat protein